MQVSSEAGGIPQKAIDGSTSSFFNTETCTLTRPERVPWWYVNLLEPYMVQLVRLDFGKSCCGKLYFSLGMGGSGLCVCGFFFQLNSRQWKIHSSDIEKGETASYIIMWVRR